MSQYKHRGLRRSYDRRRIDASAALNNEGDRQEVILRDLSVGGAGIICSKPLQVCKRAVIDMRQPFFGLPVSPKVSVIWCKKIDEHYWRIGLKFDSYAKHTTVAKYRKYPQH